MYSVVLATMLAAGGQSTGTWFHGCHGCWGCSGCYGCWGGYSNGCWGCSGCYGCWGGYSYGCWGCSGCYGCWGCSGCYGYTVVHPTVVYGYSCSGCYGCCGGWIVSGGQYQPQQIQVRVNSGGSEVTPLSEAERDAVRRLLKSLRQEMKGDKGKGGKEESSVPAPDNVARITVRLPAEAQMWVDGVYCPLTSNVRSFNTPALQDSTQYQYTLRVRYERDGQPQEESRRVLVRSGQQVNVDFNNLVSTVGR